MMLESEYVLPCTDADGDPVHCVVCLRRYPKHEEDRLGWTRTLGTKTHVWCPQHSAAISRRVEELNAQAAEAAHKRTTTADDVIARLRADDILTELFGWRAS